VLLDLGSVSVDWEYCQKTLPALKQLRWELDANIPFEILSVNVIYAWDPDAVMHALRYFSEQQQITWTVGIVEMDSSNSVFRAAYDTARHVPSLMLLGPDGEILATRIKVDQLSHLVQQVLGESN
jgi:thiol-disulfide isomerase/thioredoxin